MAISEQDKQAIDEAVSDLYHVSVNDSGAKAFCPFYPDYRDTNESLIQIAYDNRNAAFQKDHESGYAPEEVVIASLESEICSYYDEQAYDVEGEILEKAGFDISDDLDEHREYLREEYCMEYPFDHYLSQSIQVNVLLGGKEESNLDFGSIHSQCEALSGKYTPAETREALEQESGLSFLVKQQSYTMDQLKETVEAFHEAFYGENADRSAKYDTRFANFLKEHNPFLSYMAQEVDNTSNYMNCVVVLAKMNMYQFAEMMKPGKEVTFPKDAMIGFFNPWVGGASALDIQLDKDLVVPSELIWDAQIEGAKLQLNGQYSVDSVCGLVSSCWEEVKSIQDPEPEKKPGLDTLIQAAQTQVQSGDKQQGVEKETGR